MSLGVAVFHSTVWERIEQAQRQDTAAVEGFVAVYRAPLLAYVRRWSVPGVDPEDLVQEILVELFPGGALRQADQERGRFRGYLLGIAKHVVQRALRRGSAQKRGGGQVPASLLEADVVAPAPDDADFDRIWSEHLLKRALKALAQQNPRQREALRRRFEQGQPYEEIAAAMGRSLQQVKNDLHRGREFLKVAVQDGIAHYASSQEEYLAELEALRRFVGLWT